MYRNIHVYYSTNIFQILTPLITDSAQRDLNEALPALDAALNSLKSLNKNDVVEVRAMTRPPEGVKMVMEAVCIMRSVKPKKVPGDKVFYFTTYSSVFHFVV